MALHSLLIAIGIALLMIRVFFKTPSFTLLALLNRGINPMDSSCENSQIHTVFAVFSKNALIQNRLRIVLKWVLKKPHKYKTVLIPSKNKVNIFKTLNEKIVAVYNGK